ncbi:hypothetical protein Plhal304r1_c009g0037691 [Plasmopara halstedii]
MEGIITSPRADFSTNLRLKAQSLYRRSKYLARYIFRHMPDCRVHSFCSPIRRVSFSSGVLTNSSPSTARKLPFGYCATLITSIQDI